MNQRENRLRERLGTIKRTLEQAKEADAVVSYDKLRAECVVNFGCSDRLSKEMIDSVLLTIGAKVIQGEILWN